MTPNVYLCHGLCSWSHTMTSSNGNMFHVTGNLPPHKGQWRGALMFSLIWINGWVNNREAGDLRRHYDVNVMNNSHFSCNIETDASQFLMTTFLLIGQQRCTPCAFWWIWRLNYFFFKRITRDNLPPSQATSKFPNFPMLRTNFFLTNAH